MPFLTVFSPGLATATVSRTAPLKFLVLAQFAASFFLNPVCLSRFDKVQPLRIPSKVPDSKAVSFVVFEFLFREK